MNPFSRTIINGVLDRGRSLPSKYRLFYSRTPNNWLDVGWEGDFGWDSELSTWSIPRTVIDWTGATRDMFTILGEGLFFDSAGNSLSVTGTQILAWSGINKYHILFSLTKGLVIYDPYAVTDAVIVKADKFMRQPAYSDIPTVFFNGTDITGSSGFDSGVLGTNPGQWVPDYLGNLVNAGVDVPAMQGMRLDGSVWRDTKLDGTPILPSTLQPTRTFDAGFTTSNPSTTFKKYIRANPATDMPGHLSEPARSTYAKLPAAPATQTTASLALGTYCLWVEGTGSFQASAGTAAATGGFGAAAVAGSPVTFTITTAGTVVLTKTGTVTWVQLEPGVFPTSRIDNPLSVSSVTRAGTVLSYPTLGKIRPNNQAFRMTCVPRASGQVTPRLLSTYTDTNNRFNVYIFGNSVVASIKKSGAFSTDASVSITVSNGTALDIICIKHSTGMQLACRSFGSELSAWTNGSMTTDAISIGDIPVGTTYQIGSVNSIDQFTGNISELETLDIPLGITDPLAWAKAQWGIS